MEYVVEYDFKVVAELGDFRRWVFWGSTETLDSEDDEFGW